MIEIYPGGRVEFVISEFDEKKKRVKGALLGGELFDSNGQQLQKNPGDVLYQVEIESEENDDEVV